VIVARSFAEMYLDQPAVMSIGTFDGVHRGHQYLLSLAKERATEHGTDLVVVTFDPCPAVVLRPAIGRYQLTSAAQKLQLLEALQPTMVALLRFTPDLAQLSADEFMDALEAQLPIRELWFGEDFHFGRDRSGGLQMLVERGRNSGFSLHVVNRRADEKESISSSRVRQLVATGDVALAIPLLGHPLARECTKPELGVWLDGESDCTVCTIEPHLALPADGVYAVLGAGGYPMVAAVAGRDSLHQLRIKGAAGPGNLSIEFIDQLCTIDDYKRHPFLWDTRAHARLDQWRRPYYGPVSRA
jgi:riboflavin kinase/FMN adenylyltransferase